MLAATALAAQMDAGLDQHRNATQRNAPLEEMDKVVPWEQKCVVIESLYPKERAESRVLEPCAQTRRDRERGHARPISC